MKQSDRNRGQQDILLRVDALIEELKSNGSLKSPQVEAAFRAVPRHLFLPGMDMDEIYTDRAIATKKVDGKWVSSSSQPSMMAIMLEQLDLKPGQQVLEIGAGTGYNAALMAYLVGESGRVYTIDIAQDIVDRASQNIAASGIQGVQVICGDGGYGYPEAAPYDRIILTVGANDILPSWRKQLKPGGRLVLPLQIGAGQKSIAFEVREDHLTSLSVVDCAFMMLQGDYSRDYQFKMELGPEPGFFVESPNPITVSGETLYNLLMGPWRDWEVAVSISPRQLLRGLRFWLALQEPGLSVLIAAGDMIDHRLAPPLFGFGGEWKSTMTPALFSELGIAAMIREPGPSIPQEDPQDWPAMNDPIPLFVRQYGKDESLAQRLVQIVRDWDRRGRPDSSGLRVRVYPQGSPVQPHPGASIIEKEWTRQVFDWPKNLA